MLFISEHAYAPTGSDKITVPEGTEYHIQKCGGVSYYHDISRAAEGKSRWPVKPEHLHRPVTAKKRQLCEGRNEGGAGPRCTVSVDTFPPRKQ